MISKFLKRVLSLAGLAAATLATPAAAQTARPALWELSDPDTTIYLFGTIHLLPDNYPWRTKAIDKAIGKADTLVVETIVDQKNPQALAAELAKLGFSPGLPPLANRIHPMKRPLLEAAIAKTGIPRPVFDRMETWAAAFTLLGVQFKALGLEGEHGVEQTLREAFATAAKPVGQLETNAEQLGFFDALPAEAQRALLEGSIENPQAMSGDFTQMLRAWATGDVETIARTFNRDLADSPELMNALLARRNANWSRWIERRLASPGTVMIAVGAGHLAGSGSVQSLLQRDGYRIRRIQ
ncbi:MAG TPA: TraB/GumN family protein [Sphingomicrobium sp.]|nr:TraB/GumN family protein [Sphingomicrobium sp.]